MTVFEFITMDEAEQAQLICNAVPIDGRTEGDFDVVLYQFGRLYIEAFYHHQHTEVRYRPFTSVEQLKPYLEKIQVADLI
ncbi:MAG: hypothetical protein ACM3VS_19075 [Candidatus Dadabacteria bacterium]